MLNESLIQTLAGSQIFERAEVYYQQGERLPEWSLCIDQIRATHHRKYALIVALKAL